MKEPTYPQWLVDELVKEYIRLVGILPMIAELEKSGQLNPVSQQAPPP